MSSIESKNEYIWTNLLKFKRGNSLQFWFNLILIDDLSSPEMIGPFINKFQKTPWSASSLLSIIVKLFA